MNELSNIGGCFGITDSSKIVHTVHETKHPCEEIRYSDKQLIHTKSIVDRIGTVNFLTTDASQGTEDRNYCNSA